MFVQTGRQEIRVCCRNNIVYKLFNKIVVPCCRMSFKGSASKSIVFFIRPEFMGTCRAQSNKGVFGVNIKPKLIRLCDWSFETNVCGSFQFLYLLSFIVITNQS